MRDEGQVCISLSDAEKWRTPGSARRRGRALLTGNSSQLRSCVEADLDALGWSVECREESAPACLVAVAVLAGGREAQEILGQLQSVRCDLPVLVIAATPAALRLVESLAGSVHFLPAPFSRRELEEALAKALTVSLAAEPRLSAPRARTWLERMDEPLQHIAMSDAPVLVQGESGVGKEVLARHLHQASPRAARPFLKLNCAALPSELLESELFGYERGAFTGAFRTKPGRFELAEGGTILLDEIGDMDVRLQAKLLQVLQDREFQRLGGRETIRVDVRVVAATHCNLEEAITRQVFREDLFYRLNVINVRIPALRERQDEIVPLARLLLQRHVRPGVSPPEITPTLERVLLHYHWPGNIRELENVMRRFLVFQDCEMIASELAAKAPERRAALPDPSTPEPPAVAWPTSSVLEQVNQVKNKLEADAILLALQSTHWNRKQAAVLLDIDYRALLYKMKKLAIEDKAPAPAPAVSECVPEFEVTDLSPDLSESQRIRSALEATRWNRKQAAALLNVEYRSFLYKIKKLAV